MKLVLIKSKRDYEKNRYNKRFFGRYLKININPNSKTLTPRFGFIIPKKILPKVVDRNKIKRRIKYFLTQKASQVLPFDMIFFVKPEIIKAKYSEIAQDIKEVFNKAQLWKPLK
jgi:ribonuclease P protein component